jgi:hypothetical protein
MKEIEPGQYEFRTETLPVNSNISEFIKRAGLEGWQLIQIMNDIQVINQNPDPNAQVTYQSKTEVKIIIFQRNYTDKMLWQQKSLTSTKHGTR